MKTITVPARGYYDTASERYALLAEGTILPISDHQIEALCKSKRGRGVWAIGTCLNVPSIGKQMIFIDSK